MGMAVEVGDRVCTSTMVEMALRVYSRGFST